MNFKGRESPSGSRTSVWRVDGLPPVTSTVGKARRFVTDTLLEVGRADAADDAALVVSEIVTNAVVHAGTHVDVSVRVDGSEVWVGVTDGSSRAPRVTGYSDMAGTGRGLRLVEEVADDWGIELQGRGKVVWFRLMARSAPDRLSMGGTADDARSEASAADQDHGERRVLLNVPVLLFAAWRQHADALLREQLLVSLRDGDELAAIEAHSGASDALSLLDEAIPSPAPPRDPATALAAAIDPSSVAARVEVMVTAAGAQHLASLDAALDAAAASATADLFLTPPVPPELTGMRRWLCGQLRDQVRGAAPRPWDETLDQGPSSRVWDRPASDWDATHVRASTSAVLAADDAGRLVAASVSAAELLGHATPAELVGRRLLTVIPARFHQAHLAGFTRHLLTGSGALLDASVRVPVARRDGSEVDVVLTLRVEHDAQGRNVYVADLDPG